MRSLSPEGGRSEKLYGKFPRGTGDRIDRLAAERGLSRSAYLREVVLGACEADEAQLEEAPKAS